MKADSDDEEVIPLKLLDLAAQLRQHLFQQLRCLRFVGRVVWVQQMPASENTEGTARNFLERCAGPGGLGAGESQALLISCDFHLSESQASLVSGDFRWSESQALLVCCDFHWSETHALLVSCDFHWSWGLETHKLYCL